MRVTRTGFLAGCWKRTLILRSAATHLLFLLKRTKQIPRSARDDIGGGFFSGLLGCMQFEA
jgi:hypothetical protein